jgi:hypothetical protein
MFRARPNGATDRPDHHNDPASPGADRDPITVNMAALRRPDARSGAQYGAPLTSAAPARCSRAIAADNSTQPDPPISRDDRAPPQAVAPQPPADVGLTLTPSPTSIPGLPWRRSAPRSGSDPDPVASGPVILCDAIPAALATLANKWRFQSPALAPKAAPLIAFAN